MRHLFILIFVLSSLKVYSQKNKPNAMETYQRDMLANHSVFRDTTSNFKGLTLGWHRGKEHFFEIGYAGGVRTSKTVLAGLGSSLEMNFKDNVYGYKASLFVNAGLSMGIDMLLYKDLNYHSDYYKQWAWGFRPNIGLGLSVFSITYGYNAMITNPKMPNINRHMFSLRYIIPIVKGR
ncbi:MAG: hypothetical protein K2X86_06745 [Cytophagaceae bacterium]|nr:hypothetical protein [Cytophagaceae bacterium]